MVRSVRSVILVTLGLFLAVALGVEAFALWSEHGEVLDRAERTTRDVAALLEEHARRTFETGDLVFNQIETLIGRAGGIGAIGSAAAFQKSLSELAGRLPAGGKIWIVGPDGRPISMSDRFPANTDSNVSELPWFKAHTVDGQSRFVGEARPGPDPGEVFFSYSRSLSDPEGRLQAVVLLMMRPTLFAHLMMPAEYARDSGVGVYRSSGALVARYPFRLEFLGRSIRRSPIIDGLQGQPSGTYRGRSALDGVERIVSFRRLDDLGLVVTASAAVHEVLASWYRLLGWSGALLAVVLGAVSWLMWLGLRLSNAEAEAQSRLQKALADREILFQEVHHRIKNNLATVASLLTLQARNINDVEAKAPLQETTERVRSISLIHETLYQTGHASDVDMTEFLQRLLLSLAEGYGSDRRGIQIHADMNACVLDLQKAIPIALIVNEAVVNAFKHAFGKEEGGSITLRLRCDAERYLFQVADSGRGMPERVSAQVGGEARFENSGGTVFSLSLPLAAE